MGKAGFARLLVCVIVLGVTVEAPPASAAEGGVCGGVPCGPSGAFTAATFPTSAGIDFSALPANPARPYTPWPGARAWYVSTRGTNAATGDASHPLRSINVAISRASAGDVIWVANGIYAIGTREDDVAIHVPDGVTLAARNIGGVRLVPRFASVHYGVWAEGDDVVLDGFRIRGFRSYQVQFGRIATTQRNVVLKHLVTTGGEAGVSAVDFDPNQPRVDGLLAYDIKIRAPRTIGFNCGIGPCNDMRIEAVRVRGSGGAAGNSGADGIAVEEGDNIVVFNATVTGMGADGIDLKATRAAVVNAWVHDVLRNGVKLWKGGDLVNAVVSNTGADAAVVFQDSGSYRMLNTVVARHNWRRGPSYAATVGYPDVTGSLEVANSIFFSNAGPLFVSPNFSLDVRDSIFYGSRSNGEIEWSTVAVGDDPDDLTAFYLAGGGSNDRIVDPRFRSPRRRDYRLASGSPAIDTGATAANMPNFDLYGRARVRGSAVDVGAIETVSP